MKISRIRTKIEAKDDFPRQADIHWWRKYCIGSPKSQLSSESESEDNSRSENVEDQKVEPKIKPKINEGHQPLLKDVISFSQSLKDRLLNYHGQWINEFGFNNQIGVWVYSLLACLEKPLSNENHSTIRDLSRACSETRSKLEPTDPLIRSINVIIAINGRYFSQLDMVDG